MDWFTKSWRTKKKKENNFQSVHKKNKGYGLIGIVTTRLDEAEY